MEGSISLGKRVFMIFQENGNGPPIGTGFCVSRPEVVLTAHHVVKDENQVHVLNTSGKKLQMVRSSKVISHPTADVAVIIIPGGAWHDAEQFELGIPPTGYSDFPLGEEVISYGFPHMGAEKPIPPRLMKGHLQRQFQYKDEHYTYSSYELGFPAFPGQSGSPVVLDNFTPNARQNAIGVVTRSISFKSERAGDVSEASWAIAASLTPLSDWIRAIPAE